MMEMVTVETVMMLMVMTEMTMMEMESWISAPKTNGIQ